MYFAKFGGALRGKAQKTLEPAYAEATAWQATDSYALSYGVAGLDGTDLGAQSLP